MSTTRSRTALRAGAVLAAATAMALYAGGTAFAHVSAQPGEATKGGYTKVAFRVPNERTNAGTIKIEVTLPAEYPLTSVRTSPLAGWKATLTKGPGQVGGKTVDVVKTITWTADAGIRINPDEFAEFEATLGKLPDNTDQFIMPTSQTYDNNEVVKWDAPPAKDGQEPDKPAPMLKLVAAKSGEDHHGGAAAAPAANQGASKETPAAAGQDNTARWLAGGGLAVGALGLGFGIGAILRGRRAAA